MDVFYSDDGQRGDILEGVRKVVVKVGTRMLTGIEGSSKGDRIRELVARIAGIRQRGIDVILVTSGAIGAGMLVLGTRKRPSSLSRLQAHAAVGQSRLMYLYETACQEHGFHCAQILLTAADVRDRERHLNVTACMNALLSSNVLPVVNENDSVSVEEIQFGDNDMLAALVAVMTRADLTILLTAVDGLHEIQPGGKLGNRISVVPQVNGPVMNLARNTDDSTFSTGGMITKLQAAAHVTKAGEPLWIASGLDFGILETILDGKDVGTLFTAQSSSRMRGHQRFLTFFAGHAGDIVVDSGAERALLEHGRSLLPSGITQTAGNFRRGDTVRILNPDGREIARGVTNYSNHEVDAIKGRHSRRIRDLLGYDGYDAVVHRNYMAVTRHHRE